MSNTDSFVDEVTEEVKRDRLYGMLRRYGWIGILAVLLLVGGASYSEWQKAKTTAAAQQLGDSILRALEKDDAGERLMALQGIEISGRSNAAVALIVASEAQGNGDIDAAIAGLSALKGDASLPQVYRDLAELKLVLLQGSAMPADERRTVLGRLAIAGGAFRMLAEEQLALLDIENNDSEAAITRLNAILVDVEVTSGLRMRATQLIMALGGEAIEAQQ